MSSSDTFSVAFLRRQLCLRTGTYTAATIAEVATAVGYLTDGCRGYVPRPDPCRRCAPPLSGAGAIGARLSRSSGRFHVRVGTTRGRGTWSSARRDHVNVGRTLDLARFA
jgi:hypothetical protein